MRRWVGLAAAVLAGCANAPEAPAAHGSNFLFVWAADKDKVESDFMAVIDLRPGSASYGDVVATAPIGATGTMPHHVEYEFPEGGMLFGDGFTGNHDEHGDYRRFSTDHLTSLESPFDIFKSTSSVATNSF